MLAVVAGAAAKNNSSSAIGSITIQTVDTKISWMSFASFARFVYPSFFLTRDVGPGLMTVAA